MLKLVDDDFDDAPEGQVWVCGVCGRHGKNRYNLSDISCGTWAVLCYEKADADELWKRVPRTC